MKTLIAILTLTATMSAFAMQTGTGNNGPWTVGPLGYTDPLVSSRGTQVSSLGSSVGSLASLNMKAVAVAIENDTQNYFQSGEMSVLLASHVEKIMNQNPELSVDEAVSIVLDFAQLHK